MGVWSTPPVDSGEVKERVGLNDEYEEHAIHNYELPFEIDEYTPIEEVNRLCGLAGEFKGTPIGEVASEIRHAFSDSLGKMVRHMGDIIYYPDCNDMGDAAYYLIVGADDLDEVPEYLKTYTDFDMCGRDLETGGNYLVMSRGVFELM